MQKYSLLYAFGTAFLTFLTAAFLFHRLLHEADQEIENHLLDIVSEDYSEVKALKDFSMVEYRHAVKVSDIAFSQSFTGLFICSLISLSSFTR